MSARDQTSRTASLADLASPSWFVDPAASSLWVCCYQVVRTAPKLRDAAPHQIDLNLVRAVLFHGTFPHTKIRDPEFTVEQDIPTFAISNVSNEHAPKGDYLFLLTPHTIDGVPGVEEDTKSRLATAAGLLASVFGRNVIYRRYHEMVLNLRDGSASYFTPVLENPAWFPEVDTRPIRVRMPEQLSAAIQAQSSNDRNRIELSLRWFERSLFDGGVDSFLQAWIAIESLAMPETDVRPVVELMARAYELPYDEAVSRFSIGRLQGLRSRIVHKGQIVPIDANLMRYLEALYVDCLYATIGLPTERRSDIVRTAAEFDLSKYLHERGGG